jgi:phasin family protein
MKDLNTQMADVAKANVESAVEMTNAAMSGVEKMIDLQLKAAKASMGQTAEHVKALVSAKDVQELVKVQSAYAMPSMESAVSYANSIYGIMSETGNAFAKMVEAQIAANNEKVVSAVEEFSKSAPAGS